MYGKGSPFCLSQGDLVIVPFPGLPEQDPRILSDDVRPAPDEFCQKCGEQRPQRKPAKTKRFTPLSERQKKSERLFITEDEAESTVASIKPVVAIVLSHSCDVDNSDFIRFALVQPLARLSAEEQVDIRQRTPGKHVDALYLPSTERQPESYVNLDVQFSLQAFHLGEGGSFFSRRKKRHETILIPFEDIIESR